MAAWWLGVVAGAVPPAGAASIFFGEDINTTATGQNENAVRIPHPNADAARAAFLAQLVGVETETFESLQGSATSLTFGADTASLSPAVPVLVQSTGTFNGVYPISGDRTLLETSGANPVFAITFSAPQAAFGFYATDIEIPGNLVLRFTRSDATILDQPVATQAGTGGANHTGSVVYFGIIDADNPFVSVSFLRPAAIDGFGFDDMTIGRVDNVIPEPGTFALLAGGIGALALSRRRPRNGRASRRDLPGGSGGRLPPPDPRLSQGPR